MMNDILVFQRGNAKLGKNIYTFSLPSGFTCPGANECLSRANRQTGTIVDGPQTVFRCFSASQEALYPSARKSRWNNFDTIVAAMKQNQLVDLIVRSVPAKANVVRVHVAGDFFSQAYFDAWMVAANRLPHVTFYAYTKSINFWVNRLGLIPDNFHLNASYGGKHDALISQHNLKFARVVYSVEEASSLGLEIDHDDTHAFESNSSFALLLHGTQPKGSVAAKALSVLRKQGIGGYGKQRGARSLVAA